MENQNPDQNQATPVQPTVVVNQSSAQGGVGQLPIPGAVGVLVFGIISIVTFYIFGIPGIVFGIIAMIKGKKVTAVYNANPGQYKKGMLSLVTTGKILGIVGMILGAIVMVFYLLAIIAAA